MKKATLTILILVAFNYLYSNQTNKDMTKVTENLVGNVYSFLTVIKKLKSGYECVCICGNLKIAQGYNLIRGKAKSCGCLRKTVAHYLAKTPTWYSWCAMRGRCYKINHHQYKNYGGRGIKVCDRWLNSFIAFYEDMGQRPEGHTIDRIDVNGDYYKENCKWSTYKEQNNNKRDNRIITYQGRTMNATQWANELGVKTHLIYDRIGRRGWSIDDAFTKPADKRFLRKG